MGIERVTHYIDNVLTEAQARMGLSNTRLLVAWYTNWENKQSVVHSHPYHELVLPIGGSTVRYSVDGSVYLVHVGELVYFPSQIYHSGNFNIDDAQSDRLVIQIDDAPLAGYPSPREPEKCRLDARAHRAGQRGLPQVGLQGAFHPHGAKSGTVGLHPGYRF